MIRQSELKVILDDQKVTFSSKKEYLKRHSLEAVPHAENFVTLITGIRRCGKSVLVRQLLEKQTSKSLYLNFEDIRLSSFETDDFKRLHREIQIRNPEVVFFDEIQLVPKWEIFIHQLLNENYRVFITGSNASLLSQEMGTHLTGRHLSMELFPFSYAEFLDFKKKENNESNFLEYLETGGMPEFVKTGMSNILRQLVDDILVRDLAVRFGVREVTALKELAVYLFFNVAKPVSANRLTGLFGIKSTTTILDFFDYYREAYLLEFLPQYSHSLRAIARNPKKVYAIDTGITGALSLSASPDFGRKLENLVYLHLRRQGGNLFFYKGKKECDFVVRSNTQTEKLIQVCYEVNDENFNREIEGLFEAMQFFKKDLGYLLTFNQQDQFTRNGKVIEMMPASEFLLSKL